MSSIKKAVAKTRAHIDVTGDEGSVKKVVRSSQRPEKLLWNFSLRYWTQMEFFGLNTVDARWFVSMLERLRQLSSEELDRMLRDPAAQGHHRYHPIDWGAKNIPINKDQLESLPAHYRDDPDYELHQFQISTGRGRVVGFFDEKWIFNVVLLDPLHNLQPSGNYDYKVDPCSPLRCEVSELREGIRLGLERCQEEQCAAAKHFGQLAAAQPVYLEAFDILMVKIKDAETLATAKDLVEAGQAKSLADIFESGILATMEQVRAVDSV